MKSDSKIYRFFFGLRGERHLPFGAMLLVLVPFLIGGLHFQNRKYNALAANPEQTSTVISDIGYIGPGRGDADGGGRGARQRA